jgi:cytidylate kinase
MRRPQVVWSEATGIQMIKVITIDREYGSGASEIARKLADRLGWKLWDQALSSEIAKLAKCPCSEVEEREERRDPLFHSLFKAFARGSFEGNIDTQPIEMLDADSILEITKKLVQKAVDEGKCVIVGRGSAYHLAGRRDAFHVFIYAPPEEKVRRLRESGHDRGDAMKLIESVDRDRAAFIKRYFGKEWPNRHLFHLMINSEIGDDAVIDNILHAVSALDRQQPKARVV